jgi:hypothetical protein
MKLVEKRYGYRFRLIPCFKVEPCSLTDEMVSVSIGLQRLFDPIDRMPGQILGISALIRACASL